MIYKNKFGEVDILNKKYNFDNKVIGLSMSGGADSTMLCYLLAKTIQKEKLNIIIQPYTGYDIDIPHDSEKLPNIIEYIRNKFPDIKIRWPIAVTFKSNGKDIKIRWFEEGISFEDWKNGESPSSPMNDKKAIDSAYEKMNQEGYKKESPDWTEHFKKFRGMGALKGMSSLLEEDLD